MCSVTIDQVNVSNTNKRDIVNRARYIHNAIKAIEKSIQCNDDEAVLKGMQILKKFIDEDRHIFSMFITSSLFMVATES